MQYFKKYFSDVNFEDGTEVKVLCPFHSDTVPSASINTEKNLFHCYVCGIGFNEQQFISRINNISQREAAQVLDKFAENQARADWEITEKAQLWANNDFLNKVRSLGLSDNTIEELDLGMVEDNMGRHWLGVPVFYNGVLMDTRRYNLLKIEGQPKMRADEHAKNGFIVPYDLWKKEDISNPTYIFEGEKDMLIARELGINAITLTGGANASPNEFVIHAFENRDVVVCYDNDDAGRLGMKQMNKALKHIAKSVQYINIGDVVKENKGDFHDFVMKYNCNAFDFYALVTHPFDEVVERKIYTPIKKALKNNILRKSMTAQIIVSAAYEDTYAVPTRVVGTKGEEKKPEKEALFSGEQRSWYLETRNFQDVLDLIEVDAKKDMLHTKYLKLLNLPTNEPNIHVQTYDYETVYKLRITDKSDSGIKDREFSLEQEADRTVDVYSNTNMLVGGQYEITYSIYPHPTKHQRLVGIVTSAKSIGGYEDFKPDKTILSHFKNIGSTIKEKLKNQFEAMKHHVAKHLNYNLWLMLDLVFNSVLEFDYGSRIKGALDVFILGDTQVGKSETSSALVNLYEFGHFLSLKTSSTVGLVGGSNKVDGSWLNTVGAIPRQHKRLVVLEEFSGARADFIKTITDMRSSYRIRLARAAGEMDVPCMLRMITISNPINDENGHPRHLSTFPNGVSPLMELIKSAEDVARYDGFLLVSKPKTRANPFELKLVGEKIPKEYYEHKLRWIYTRKPEDVVFEDGVESYIWEQAEALNEKFECNFPLFGTTTSLKLARFTVAMAALLVSTDDDYEKVIVTKEHVDATVDFLNAIYDNSVFRLKEYKQEYDSYNRVTKDELGDVQRLYNRNSVMFDFLEHQSMTSRNNLRSVSGLDGDSFNPVFNTLVRLRLIRLSGETVFPTEKFRIAMARIDKSVHENDTMLMTKIK